MEKIVPFKRDISFETKIAEIRSISLEHTYEIQNNLISGTFIISGNYKLTDTSTNVDPFKFEIPFDISIDSRYELNKATVDINDFFYELINNEVLSVSITLIIDNLEEKEEREMEEIQEEKQEVEEIKPVSYEETEKDDETEEVKPVSASPETVKSIFDNMDENEGYVVYKVHIVTENDTIESIMEKYDVTNEALEAYNNLNDLKIGDKLIVPA